MMTGWRWFSDLVQHNGQALCEMPEVTVRCEDGQIAPNGHRTNEEIRVRALNTLGSARVEKLRGCHIILCQERNVGERGKVGFQMCKLSSIPHTGENLLPDGTNDFGDMDGHEPPQLLPLWLLQPITASQGQRPYARIDEHLHGRARWRL